MSRWYARDKQSSNRTLAHKDAGHSWLLEKWSWYVSTLERWLHSYPRYGRDASHSRLRKSNHDRSSCYLVSGLKYKQILYSAAYTLLVL